MAVAVSKMVTKMLRHFDQDERLTDGSRHWDSIKPVLLRAFAQEGARDFDAGAIPISPELMKYTFIPYKRKEYTFHRGISWNFQSILESGIIPGRKENDRARQAVFLTPLNPFGNDPEED